MMKRPIGIAGIVGVVRAAEGVGRRNHTEEYRWFTSHDVAKVAGVTPVTARKWLQIWHDCEFVECCEVKHRSNTFKRLYRPSAYLWRIYFTGTEMYNMYDYFRSFSLASELAARGGPA